MASRATLLLLAFSYCGAAQQPPSFQSEINLVNVTMVVRSMDGALLRTLNQDDFEVLEDGAPQTMHFFTRESESPLSLGVIVDASGSQEKFLKQHNHDVEAFLTTVLKPSDQAFAICFGNHLRLVSDATADASAILSNVKRFQKGDRQFPEIGPKEDRDLGTAFYDALYFSMTEKLNTDGRRRRALVVFSDGEENSSEHDLLDVIEKAQESDTVVYCIRYTEKEHGKVTARNKYGMRVMNHISTLSGGADFDALETGLGSAFSPISDELHSMYQIGYVSSNGHPHDGSFRKLTIRCKQAGSIVRAKAGYYAR